MPAGAAVCRTKDELAQMTVKQLQGLAREAGESAEGTKKELIHRLVTEDGGGGGGGGEPCAKKAKPDPERAA
eukprot:gene13864-11357_t